MIRWNLILLLFFSCFAFSCSKANDELVGLGENNSKKSNNLELGNPSNAKKVIADSLNYLIEKEQFTLSYNSSKCTANWVSWHLNKAWLGNTSRQDNFKSDSEIPFEFYKVKESDYSGSGFDRGHMCPSADRTANELDNSNTFLMSNMIPQAPNLNRIVWKDFEEYCRALVDRGYELFIVSGGIGEGGIGSHDTMSSKIANNTITVPAYCWKVALILKDGENDLLRIDSNTIIISSLVPNVNGLNKNWFEYITTTNAIEGLTGYNFFSNVRENVQEFIESKKNFPF